jgi:hypothetical protein
LVISHCPLNNPENFVIITDIPNNISRSNFFKLFNVLFKHDTISERDLNYLFSLRLTFKNKQEFENVKSIHYYNETTSQEIMNMSQTEFWDMLHIDSEECASDFDDDE